MQKYCACKSALPVSPSWGLSSNTFLLSFFVSNQIVAAIFAIAGIVMMTYADGFHSHSVIGIALVVGSASMSALYKVSTPGSFPSETCLSPSSLTLAVPVILANLCAVQCHVPFFESSAVNAMPCSTAFGCSLALMSALTKDKNSYFLGMVFSSASPAGGGFTDVPPS